MFSNNKFSKQNSPSTDKECKLGVHTTNNSINVQVSQNNPNNSKKKYPFYWRYKKHVIYYAISNLLIAELTTTVVTNENVNFTEILTAINEWFTLKNSYIIPDKGYDSKENHNFISYTLKSHTFIALNKC